MCCQASCQARLPRGWPALGLQASWWPSSPLFRGSLLLLEEARCLSSLADAAASPSSTTTAGAGFTQEPGQRTPQQCSAAVRLHLFDLALRMCLKRVIAGSTSPCCQAQQLAVQPPLPSPLAVSARHRQPVRSPPQLDPSLMPGLEKKTLLQLHQTHGIQPSYMRARFVRLVAAEISRLTSAATSAAACLSLPSWLLSPWVWTESLARTRARTALA